jgi:3-oxoacyl-[acyl-carrier-protein] synthase II
VVVAGGAEAVITPVTIAGFGEARTLSTRDDEPERASRPFDVDLDGFVLGEGAGVVVLERAELEFAGGRRARRRGVLAGFGITSDATTSPGPIRWAPVRSGRSARPSPMRVCSQATSTTSTAMPPPPSSGTSVRRRPSSKRW